MLTKSDAVRQEVPVAFTDRYVVRCVNAKFGLSKKQNPMITLDWEVVGKPNASNSVDTELVRNGVKYQIAGLRCNSTYLTLIPGRAYSMFCDFQEKLHLFTDIDEENPDLNQYSGLEAEAIVGSEEGGILRKELTEDEVAAGKTIGDPVTDADGNDLRYPNRAVVKMFLRKYEGQSGSAY